MQIERCREDCYDLSNLQAAGEELSQIFSRCKINLKQANNCQICLYVKFFWGQRLNNSSLHISRK